MTVSQTDSPSPTSLMFEPNHPVPNNPDLPVLVYTQVLSPQFVDLATRFEEMFTTQGWRPSGAVGFMTITTTIPKGMRCLVSLQAMHN